MVWGTRRLRYGLAAAGLQRLFQLPLKQHLTLHHGVQQSRGALIDRQNLLGAGTGLSAPRERAQNILQLFTLGVDDVAERQLLHGNGSNDHRERLVFCHIGPAGRKRRHRHSLLLQSTRRSKAFIGRRKRRMYGAYSAPPIYCMRPMPCWRMSNAGTCRAAGTYDMPGACRGRDTRPDDRSGAVWNGKEFCPCLCPAFPSWIPPSTGKTQ